MDTIKQINWFNVRIVWKGEQYGLHDILQHEKNEPLVEFYDTRHSHTKRGQFVSRYSLSTILHHNGGLCLNGGVLDWNLSYNEVRQVKDFLDDTIRYEKGTTRA